MLSIIKNDNITSEHNSFYFELSIKQNVDIYGITVYMQKNEFEIIFIYNYDKNIQYVIGKVFGYIERAYSMGVN